MFRYCRFSRITDFVVNSRNCCRHHRQFAVQPVIRRASTLVGHDTAVGTSTVEHSPVPWNKVIYASHPVAEKHVSEGLRVYEDFITEEEESSLFNEVEPYLKRLHYEFDHWDDAINGYRETEKREWNEKNKGVLQRVRSLAFAPGELQLEHVHVLDVMPGGVIRAHIDSIRFCGSTIAGLSLLSSSVMRLIHHEEPTHYADILLARRSLYIMQGAARYKYTHEVLPNEKSFFKGQKVERTRRISVICRSDPFKEDDDVDK